MSRPAFSIAAPSLVAAILFLALPSAARAADLEGTASVVSANVIAVGDTRLRLAGIEAPRPDQVCLRDDSEWECGRSAVAYLAEVIASRPVRCTVVAETPGQTPAARCLAGPDDLALKMVLAGFAFAYRREGEDYSELEGVAQRLRRGLWTSDFLLSGDLPR